MFSSIVHGGIGAFSYFGTSAFFQIFGIYMLEKFFGNYMLGNFWNPYDGKLLMETF